MTYCRKFVLTAASICRNVVYRGSPYTFFVSCENMIFCEIQIKVGENRSDVHCFFDWFFWWYNEFIPIERVDFDAKTRMAEEQKNWSLVDAKSIIRKNRNQRSTLWLHRKRHWWRSYQSGCCGPHCGCPRGGIGWILRMGRRFSMQSSSQGITTKCIQSQMKRK